ncbi:hypothetical protein A6U84_03230 [Agrobacterium sp. 13-2099-1-2]|uniref:hypothetical protein n=1 Tax=Agrobacterium sp. 13-2099-1-2 TaxID=1841651 RepID=UPI001146E8F7|nr:hypothetical protein [Agrobacterium sp. 13-2099-1-2]UZX42336.1 hypothetical protein A6U84_03230 [Agrobacterium sp. 13-2099-1-2]
MELHTVGERVGEMPDDAMDHITEAHWIVSKAIINAPVTCEADVAGKLRHAALLVECPHGEYVDEIPAIAAALGDLRRLRKDEWADAVKEAKRRS